MGKIRVQAELNLQFWTRKAAVMKLRGEDQTYPWEYARCLERMALFQRLLDKVNKRQEAPLRSSSTKPRQ